MMEIERSARQVAIDVAAILVEVAGLDGAAMRGTDNAALAAVATEARLAELDGANLPTDIDMLLSRLTAARAGYLDELAAANLPTDVDSILTEVVKIDTLEDLFLERRVVKAVTFDGGAGTGAVGTVALFTVTGGVDVDFEAFCTTDLTEAAPTATIEVGVAGNTDYIIETTNATDIDAGIWNDASPGSNIELTSDASKKMTIKGANIIATIGAQNIATGVIQFSILYKPRTSGASLVEAA